MKRLMRGALAFISGIFASYFGTVGASAQSCTSSITSIDFGVIDVTANIPFSTTGTYSISCGGFIAVTAVRSCPNINQGLGGADPSGNPRYLMNGMDRLNFNIFSDVSHATLWGSRYWIGAPPTVDIPLFVNLLGIQIGTSSASHTLYAEVPAGQQTVPPGTYSSVFSGGQTALNYDGFLLDLPLLAPTCATLNTPSATTPFTVTATIAPNCGVSASSLNFGSAGVLSLNIDASTTLAVTCSATTPYTVALNGGLSGAVDPQQRKMQKGSEAVVYGLYHDAVRTQPWGESVGLNTISGVGTGLSQNYIVYGRVAPQPTPSPGTYTDTIVATVIY